MKTKLISAALAGGLLASMVGGVASADGNRVHVSNYGKCVRAGPIVPSEGLFGPLTVIEFPDGTFKVNQAHHPNFLHSQACHLAH